MSASSPILYSGPVPNISSTTQHLPIKRFLTSSKICLPRNPCSCFPPSFSALSCSLDPFAPGNTTKLISTPNQRHARNQRRPRRQCPAHKGAVALRHSYLRWPTPPRYSSSAGYPLLRCRVSPAQPPSWIANPGLSSCQEPQSSSGFANYEVDSVGDGYWIFTEAYFLGDKLEP